MGHLQNKGNHWQNEKKTNWMRENVCEWHAWQVINIQNIEIAHTTQNPENKQCDLKMGRGPG